MNERCDDILNADGSSYRCQLERGHAGLHENGDWEWTSRDMAAPAEIAENPIPPSGLMIWPYFRYLLPLFPHLVLVRCSKCPAILVKQRSSENFSVLPICSNCILRLRIPGFPDPVRVHLVDRVRAHRRELSILSN